MKEVFDSCGYDVGFQQDVDINGKPVERDRYSHPYNYDPFMIWKGDYNAKLDGAVYSDRLYSWDNVKYDKCHREVWGNESQLFNNCSPESIEKFLSLYFDKDVTLTGVEQGCNVSTGFPYWIFYYR